MTIFQYPKTKHTRRISPRQFKRYQTYKPYLQAEFSRVCVYCRQPDSSAPNIVFGVDHYRPKGISRFASLACDYNNLYYCCNNCNSRKNNYWPLDENKGPYIVNPCDYDMAKHLRFDSATGKVEVKSIHGKLTEELLQLNDNALVKFRIGELTIIRLFIDEIKKLEDQLKTLTKRFKSGKLNKAEYDIEEQAISQDLIDARYTLNTHTGELPLPPLPKMRLGVNLIKP